MVLSPELKVRYAAIRARFDAIADSWQKYEDEIIPQDNAFALDILDFLVDVLAVMDKQYEKIDPHEWTQFLAEFWYGFFYGPQGDSYNYLAFDEVNVGDILLGIDEDVPLNKVQIAALKKELIEARRKLL